MSLSAEAICSIPGKLYVTYGRRSVQVQAFIAALLFSPVKVSPLVLHNHCYLQAALFKRASGRSPETFNKEIVFSWK